MCPICQNKIDPKKATVKTDTINWLNELQQDGILESWLFYSKTIHEQAQKGATTQVITESIHNFEKRMMDLTEKQLAKFSEINQQELGKVTNLTREELTKFQDMTRAELGKSTETTRDEIGKITDIAREEFSKFSTTTQEEITKFSTNMTTITQSLSKELYKPTSIGATAEADTTAELELACTEDCIEHIGGKGQADILIKPKHKNAEIGETVIIEVKKTERWQNSYIEELEKFMGDYNTPFGILATKELPAAAAIKGFSVISGSHGIILITRLEYAALSYQILRKILITLYLQGKEVGDFRALFKDEEMIALLTQAKDYTNYVKTIRTHIRGIEKELTEMQNQLDQSIDTILHKVSAFQET
jgi:hypothetical protein